MKNLENSLQQLTSLIERQHVEASGLEESDLSASISNIHEVNLESLDALESRVDDIATKISARIPVTSPSNCDNALTSSPRPFPLNSFNIDTTSLHPSPAHAQTVWQIFKDGADQQIKVVHRPTTEGLLRQALRNSNVLENGQLALVFAIYFACIVSMTPENVQTCFKMPKGTAVAAYRSAAEQALMRANFLSVHDLTTLQALVLFVAFSGFVDQSQRVWALTGLARRLNPTTATNIGTPFQVEMKRRLWWQLWYLDYRATFNDGEDDNLSTATQEAELPANVHDEDLHPDMPQIPPPCDGWTPITFSLLRFTIARTARKVESSVSRHNKKILIDECALKVQSTYLRYCNGSEPIHWLAQHVAHVHITEMRFKLHTQHQQHVVRANESSLDRDRLILDAVDILDVPSRLKNEPESQRWKWLLNPFPHFTPLSFLLNEVSQQQIRPPPAQIWTIAENAFLRAANEMRTSKNRQILNLLMSKAKAGMRGMLEWQELSETSDLSQQVAKGIEQSTSIGIDYQFDIEGPACTIFQDFNCASVEELLSFGNFTDLSCTDFNPLTLTDELSLDMMDTGGDIDLEPGVSATDAQNPSE